jgi:hypothetical protein
MGGAVERVPAGMEPGPILSPTSTESGNFIVHLHAALSEPAVLEKVGHGLLSVIEEKDGRKIYGRTLMIAELISGERLLLVKWIRRQINWHGREAPLRTWESKIAPLVSDRLAHQRTPVVRFEMTKEKILAQISLADMTLRVPVDRHHVALWKPREREVAPRDCAQCELVSTCENLGTGAGTASLWRRLGLVDQTGVPTRRGRIVSFFQQEDGLAIAAALEDERYPLDELIYDVANLDAGFRFANEEDRWSGRLPIACHRAYGMHSVPGYLENGVPPRYGSGAEQILMSVHKNPLSKTSWITPFLGAGDIDRIIIEWRSLLRQIGKAPALEWPRWTALQAMARAILNETESPTLTDLPPLDFQQTRRIEHRLILRRH